MHPIKSYRSHLEAGGFDHDFRLMHSSGRIAESKERTKNLLDRMEKSFNPAEICIASAPGRTEMGGNHTDHNNGRVLAAAVNLDCLAVFAPVNGLENNVVTILSENYPAPITVDISDTSPRPEEEGTSEALVRGVADGFRRAGFKIGGFNACVSSTIPAGAGLSSSAAFEVLIGRIFSFLFNESKVGPLDIARVARRAENLHFAKPCGFMDQTASSFEGILEIDFEDPENPTVQTIEPGFEKITDDPEGFYGTGYRLCVVDTGGSHADLTPDYAAIPEEMLKAARCLGHDVARGITEREVMEHLTRIREKTGDRAALRLLHFIGEDERAELQAKALHAGDMDEFLRLVSESGRSSCRLLQNCYSTTDPSDQPIPLALHITELLLGSKGVARVHGGGFAGTIQAYVPDTSFNNYRRTMERLFGEGSVIELIVRQPGREFLQPATTNTK